MTLSKPPRSVAVQVDPIAYQRILKNGWCRKRLNFVEPIHTFYPAFYFMFSLGLPLGENEDHQSCTPAICYVMMRIVASDAIPLIRIRRSPSGEFSVEVVPYTRRIRFTAISHVWADQQLGSTKNILPRCQVKCLDSILAAFPSQGDDLASTRPASKEISKNRPHRTTFSYLRILLVRQILYSSRHSTRRFEVQSYWINEPHLCCGRLDPYF